MAKRRSRASKSARRRANKSSVERRKAKAAKQAAGKGKQEQASQRMKVDIPEPSPKADPEAALNAVAAYREALKEWQSLPFWKRMVTSKPRHPSGV